MHSKVQSIILAIRETTWKSQEHRQNDTIRGDDAAKIFLAQNGDPLRAELSDYIKAYNLFSK